MPTRRSTKARGYDAGHKAERARWQPTINAGNGWCHATHCKMTTRHIPPGTPWDLGHTPDRTTWTGPEHRRCNRSEGATRGNHQRGASRHRNSANRQPQPTTTGTARHSRNW